MKGFFDAEGYVNITRGVGLGINNQRLAQQIQLALLRFSTISSIHEYDNRRNKYSNNPRFTVDITEKNSLELFRKYIGFTSLKKCKKLDIIIKNKSGRSNVRQIVVPGREIREIIEKAGYNMELFPKVSNFFKSERMMSKQTFKNSILVNVKDRKLYEQLEKVYNYPILPVKISKIEKKSKNAEMVDISVKNQNFIANGVIVHNSAQRFERLREGAATDHYKKIAEYMKEQFLTNKELKGIIIGGPGVTVNTFMNKEYLTGDLKKKIIGVKDLSYTGDFGLQELLDKSQDLLAAEDVMAEKQIMGRFFEYLAKKPKMVAYGEEDVMCKLQMGAVETVLVSEECSDKTVDEFDAVAAEVGSEVVLVSTDTREGVQLRDMGKVSAILRYEVEE